MKMFFVLLVSAFVVFSSGEKCCYPPQLSGTQSSITTFVKNGEYSPSLTLTTTSMFYDIAAKKIALDGTSTTDDVTSSYRMFTDYNTKTRYTVTNGSCTVTTPEPFNGACTPDDGVFTGDAVLGDPITGLPVKSWLFTLGNNTVHLTTTTDCVPLGETVEGKNIAGTYFSTIYFTGLETSGNASLLQIPRECVGVSNNGNQGIIFG